MIDIELMTKDDVDGVTAVDNKSFKVAWSKKAFMDETENELAIYFVAKDDGVCIGYAGFWNVSGEGDITNVAVLPEYRRKGIASRLIDVMIKKANELELSLLTLEVRRSNEAAQNLYKKFGFETIGERKRYYSDNREDALIMQLELK